MTEDCYLCGGTRDAVAHDIGRVLWDCRLCGTRTIEEVTSD